MVTMTFVCNMFSGLGLRPRHKKARYEAVGEDRI